MAGKYDFEHRRRDGLRALYIVEALGGRDKTVIWAIVVIVLISSVLEEAVSGLLLELTANTFQDFRARIFSRIFIIAAFLAILAYVIHLLHKAIDNMVENYLAPEVLKQKSKPVRALVLFYSVPSMLSRENLTLEETKAALLKSAEALPDGSIHDPEWLAKLGRNNWRMPFTAIGFHTSGASSRLDRVILIGSPTVDSDFGSHAFIPEFIETANKRLRKDLACSSAIRFQSVGEALTSPSDKLEVDHAFNPSQRSGFSPDKGVFFEDMDAAIHLLFELYRTLKEEGYEEDDIMVDITGGKALSSIAGAAFAVLTRGRKFQYVDTNNYDVNSFDVYHDIGVAGRTGRP